MCQASPMYPIKSTLLSNIYSILGTWMQVTKDRQTTHATELDWARQPGFRRRAGIWPAGGDVRASRSEDGYKSSRDVEALPVTLTFLWEPRMHTCVSLALSLPLSHSFTNSGCAFFGVQRGAGGFCGSCLRPISSWHADPGSEVSR